MNNATKLRDYMKTYALTYKNVADILDVSVYTVKSWLIHDKSEKYRPLSDRNLKMIKLLLRQRKKVNK